MSTWEVIGTALSVWIGMAVAFAVGYDIGRKRGRAMTNQLRRLWCALRDYHLGDNPTADRPYFHCSTCGIPVDPA